MFNWVVMVDLILDVVWVVVFCLVRLVIIVVLIWVVVFVRLRWLSSNVVERIVVVGFVFC